MSMGWIGQCVFFLRERPEQGPAYARAAGLGPSFRLQVSQGNTNPGRANPQDSLALHGTSCFNLRSNHQQLDALTLESPDRPAIRGIQTEPALILLMVAVHWAALPESRMRPASPNPNYRRALLLLR